MVNPVDHFIDDVIIHGSPQRLVDELQGLEEMPLGYLLVSPLSDKTFDLFTERVLPRLIE